MDFPILEHLLNEISDLEVEQEEESNSNDDPALDISAEPSSSTKRKEVAKGYYY